MSPRTREQNEEIRNQRRQEILQAAVRVYVDKGYAASEIGEVAERAGMARGLVYYYFKDKQTLFRELYEHMMEMSKRFTKTHFEQEGSAFDLFSSYARTVCESVLENSVVPRFYMRISLDVHQLYTSEDFSPFEWMKSFVEPMAKAIEMGIVQGTIHQGDANLMARQFWGSVSHGMAYLDQLQQQLEAEGIRHQEVKEQLKPVLDEVVKSSVALFRRPSIE